VPESKVWRIGLIAWLYNCIFIHLEVRRQYVPCPQCGVKSSRAHSRYRRRASDLPWSSWPVQLVVNTRKFFVTTSRVYVASSPRPFPAFWLPMPDGPSDWDRHSLNRFIPATPTRRLGSVDSWAIQIPEA